VRPKTDGYQAQAQTHKSISADPTRSKLKKINQQNKLNYKTKSMRKSTDHRKWWRKRRSSIHKARWMSRRL